MANEEAFTLDGLALNDGVTFGVTSVSWPPPRQRQDWIGAADSEAQLLVRNPLHENRKITLQIAVVPQSTMDLALAKIAQVLDKLQKASKYTDGIGLVWTPATATLSCTFDVLAGEIVNLPIDWENGWLAKSPEFTVELTCKPYWRGTETLTTTASSSTPYVDKEITGVTGDIPALGRLIITDTATQSRRHVEWGLEGPLTYNSATSLLIESDNLVTSGFAGSQSTLSGAYDVGGGNTVVSATLYTTSQAVAVCGTGNLSHVGSFRVKARVHGGNPGDLVRLSWQALDGPKSANEWATLQQNGLWEELDLGTITIPAATVGTQRWTGQVEAQGLTAGTSVTIDYLVLIPVSDGYGKARASFSYNAGVVVGYDAFTSTTAGVALTARVATSGGTWTTSGEATDWTFQDSFVTGDTTETIRRNVNVDTTTGRFAILGATSYTDTQVDVRLRNSLSSAGSYASIQGLIARWTDASNYLRLNVEQQTFGSAYLTLQQVVAGVTTTLATTTWSRTSLTPYRARLIAYATGRVIAQIMSDAGALIAEISASATSVATAGTLASGKPGLRDYGASTDGAHSRYFTEFIASTPAPEPITLYSGRNMQVRYDDVLRQDSTGTYTGRPPAYRGARFLVPVGTSRVLVKARRADVETTADENVTDALQIQVGWTPRGLAVPR